MNAVPRTCCVVFLLLSLLGCGPSTFLINRDGVSGYFGREGRFLHQLLCERDDLKQVLSETSIPEKIQHELYLYDCTPDRSFEKIISLYRMLSPGEKMELRRAFKNHGYLINYVSC